MTNREIIEAFFQAQVDGDWDRFISFFAEDCEYTFPGQSVVGGTYRGHAEMRKWWDTLGQQLPTLGFEPTHIFLDGDEAAVEWRDWGANYKGVSYESWGITRVTLENGLVKRMRDMQDTQKLATLLDPPVD